MTTKNPVTASDMQYDFIAALRYPAQPASLTTILALSLSMLLTPAPLVGFVVLLVVWAAACRYSVEVLERSANGSIMAPEFAVEPDGMDWTLLILQAFLLVCQLWLDCRVETAGWRWLGIGLIACLQPAMILTAVMNRDLGAALSPTRLLHVITRLDMTYTLLIVATFVLSTVQLSIVTTTVLSPLRVMFGTLLFFVGSEAADWLSIVLSQIIAGFIWFYLMVLYFHALGRLVFACHKEFGFVPVFPDTPLRPEDRHAPLLLRVDNLVAAENFAGAARELQQCLATELHASPAMHARYRELLAKIDDQGGLLAHAKTQISALLVAGNERDALTLLRDSLARDPQFRSSAAEQTTRLARAAESHGQYDLAITLLQDFVTRNPYDFNGAANALIAAKLLLERRADIASARVVLQGAIDRFLPAHPVYEELQLELAKLDQLSRRLPDGPENAVRKAP